MANKINFITGETYTLSELFSGDRRIIIPDLQRDYCWGDDNNTKGTGEKGELVTDFVNNLLDQFNEYNTSNGKGSLNLGLFYGYEVPANHIQLCDGQQRLTTLYLLLGMVNKNTIGEKGEDEQKELTEGLFRQHLISDYEYKHDDKEPYLNYAIRESSLYFLSDLVCNFFIKNIDKVESIKSADWYFEYYNLDPSIQSMMKTLSIIENILKEKRNLDLEGFGDWLLNKVTFLYFDMENRKNGEETFVVINTTGESLSSTQNLKPLVLQEKNDKFDNTSFEIKTSTVSQNIGECWEEIETWFWKHRKEENDTADAGFAEFLRWVTIIEKVDDPVPAEYKTDSITKLIQLILQGRKCDFPYKEISFKKIYDYWKALVWIYGRKYPLSLDDSYLSPLTNKDVNNRNAIGQNDCFKLLPVLKYVCLNIDTIESDTDKQRNTKRIYEFFNNLIRIENVSKAVNTLVGSAIALIDLLSNGDLISLVDPTVDISSISRQILTEEEKRKLEIIKGNIANRNDVEEALWEAQEHNIWHGEILPMIEWATDSIGNFDLDKFRNYKEKFAEVFACDANIDLIRRSLLTRKLNNYPRIFKGYTNYSFGCVSSDWQVLINDNRLKFKEFLDDLLDGCTLNDMINSYNDTNNPFYRFVKYHELLKYCEKKNIQEKENSYLLVKHQKATTYLELETFCLYLDYKSITTFESKIALSSASDGIDYRGWKMWLYEQGLSALVFDKDVDGLPVAIEVHYNRTKENDWDVQLFLRAGNGDTETDLKSIAISNGLSWNGVRYALCDLSRSDVVDKINALLSSF